MIVATFRAGQRVKIISDVPLPYFCGKEATVTRVAPAEMPIADYAISVDSGQHIYAMAHALAPLKPQLVSWEEFEREFGWSPCKKQQNELVFAYELGQP